MDWVSQFRSKVDDNISLALQQYLTNDVLKESVQYSLFPGGKRIRPLLALAFCADLEGDPVSALPASAALELLHCSSLIHDDLPCLDNDEMRRGKPSVHRKFGEATALLTGDMMVSLAFRSVSSCRLSPATIVSIIHDLSDAFTKLCQGQQLDMDQLHQGEDLLKVHALKTGALFSACFRCGAHAAGCDGDAVARAGELGLLAGLAFQLADDFIDLFGSDSERGRSGSSDQRNSKRTFFSGGDPRRGMELLLDTQRKLDNGLTSFQTVGCAAKSDFALTRGLLDSVLGRVKEKIRSGACGC